MPRGDEEDQVDYENDDALSPAPFVAPTTVETPENDVEMPDTVEQSSQEPAEVSLELVTQEYRESSPDLDRSPSREPVEIDSTSGMLAFLGNLADAAVAQHQMQQQMLTTFLSALNVAANTIGNLSGEADAAKDALSQIQRANSTLSRSISNLSAQPSMTNLSRLTSLKTLHIPETSPEFRECRRRQSDSPHSRNSSREASPMSRKSRSRSPRSKSSSPHSVGKSSSRSRSKSPRDQDLEHFRHLFLDGIPKTCNFQFVYDTLEKFGKIEKLAMPNRIGAKLVAYLDYVHPSSGQKVLNARLRMKGAKIRVDLNRRYNPQRRGSKAVELESTPEDLVDSLPSPHRTVMVQGQSMSILARVGDRMEEKPEMDDQVDRVEDREDRMEQDKEEPRLDRIAGRAEHSLERNSEREKKRGQDLHIVPIPRNYDKMDLWNYFEHLGEIEYVWVSGGKSTTGATYAFIRFVDPSVVDYAIQHWNGHVTLEPGKPVRLSYSTSTDKSNDRHTVTRRDREIYIRSRQAVHYVHPRDPFQHPHEPYPDTFRDYSAYTPGSASYLPYPTDYHYPPPSYNQPMHDSRYPQVPPSPPPVPQQPSPQTPKNAEPIVKGEYKFQDFGDVETNCLYLYKLPGDVHERDVCTIIQSKVMYIKLRKSRGKGYSYGFVMLTNTIDAQNAKILILNKFPGSSVSFATCTSCRLQLYNVKHLNTSELDGLMNEFGQHTRVRLDGDTGIVDFLDSNSVVNAWNRINCTDQPPVPKLRGVGAKCMDKVLDGILLQKAREKGILGPLLRPPTPITSSPIVENGHGTKRKMDEEPNSPLKQARRELPEERQTQSLENSLLQEPREESLNPKSPEKASQPEKSVPLNSQGNLLQKQDKSFIATFSLKGKSAKTKVLPLKGMDALWKPIRDETGPIKVATRVNIEKANLWKTASDNLDKPWAMALATPAEDESEFDFLVSYWRDNNYCGVWQHNGTQAATFYPGNQNFKAAEAALQRLCPEVTPTGSWALIFMSPTDII